MPDSPSLRAEQRWFADGLRSVAGVDEVGRGAWAGPLSVGVAVLTPASARRLPEDLRDSKQLTASRRKSVYAALVEGLPAWAVGHASNEECDSLGMTAAQRLAARRALAQLHTAPEMVLIDGKFDFLSDGDGSMPVETIVRGDASSKAIAAASVLAKVTRDEMMATEAEHYPWYGFESNRGYPAPVHKMALATWGCTPFHRRSWSYVDAMYFKPGRG